MANFTVVSNRKGICYEGADSNQACNVFDHCKGRLLSGDELNMYMDGDVIDCIIVPEQQLAA